MQLPSEILTVLDQLLQDIEQSDAQIRPQVLSQARSYLKDFKSKDDRIFDRDRYTDFEMLLFERAFSAQLRRDEKALRVQIGVLQSDLQEKDDIIAQLRKDLAEAQKKASASMNPSQAEREKLLLDANFQRLNDKTRNLKAENAKLREQLKVSKAEISNLIARFYKNRAA